MELFLYTAGNESPEIIEVEPTATVAEVLGTGEGERPEMLWIADAEEPLEAEATLDAAGIADRAHVLRGRCHRTQVSVRFGGRAPIIREFSPAATIEHVFKWAVSHKEFNLSEEQRAKHVLAIPGADHFLEWTVLIGALLSTGTCEVVLDLSAEESFEG
jgi:hypothetical protein